MRSFSILFSITSLSLTQIFAVEILEFDPFVSVGAREVKFSEASKTGGTLEYLDNSVSGRNDTAIIAPISSSSLRTFTKVGDVMVYRFQLADIVTANNLFTPVFRVGFDFGDTAALRYATSVGTAPRIEFGSNTDGNPFAEGTVHITHEDWAAYDFRLIRFDEGNVIDVALSLELVATHGTVHDYLMNVEYSNGTVFNTKNYTFAEVHGDQVVSLFHATNSSGMVTGDTYTVRAASLEFNGVSAGATWAGFPIADELGNVNTESWLGWVNAASAPWIYNYMINSWLYVDESTVDPASGGWVYILY
jgi:hypothetical protein